MFAPLQNRFDIVGIASNRPNFELGTIPFPVKRLPSVGQAVRSRWIRSLIDQARGDHHDLCHGSLSYPPWIFQETILIQT